MGKFTANTGYLWFKQGVALFRQQPGGLVTLFLGYLFLMLLASRIPYLGEGLPIILVPALSLAFMQACIEIEQGRRLLPRLLLTGFRAPALPLLLVLGVLYLAALALVIGAATLVDGGVLWQMLNQPMQPRTPAMMQSNVRVAFVLAAALYLPTAMAFCFAAPLILWKKMSVGKALFYSFFSVWHSFKAFAVLMATWFGLGMFLASVVMVVAAGSPQLGALLMLPLSVLLPVLMHCSFYASYRQIFGPPEGVTLDKRTG